MKEKENQNQNEKWIKKFKCEFLQKPGEHLIEVGITGSGKTQGMYWLLDGLLKHAGNETIVWFDTGKSSEILTLARMNPLNLIHPEGTEIKIQSEGKDAPDIIKSTFIYPKRVWSLLKKDRINVICIKPFILNPTVHARIFTKIFKQLIVLAHNYEMETPISIFADEFHRLAPSKGNAVDLKIMGLGGWIQENIELLRSMHIRFIVSTHGWTKIRAGVRSSFNWIMPRRGAHFSTDQPKLHAFNPLFEKLNNNQAVLVFPTKYFPGIFSLPLFDVGENLGRVNYIGVLESKKEQKDEAIEDDE